MQIDVTKRDSELKFISIRKQKQKKKRLKHTHRFKDRVSVIQQR